MGEISDWIKIILLVIVFLIGFFYFKGKIPPIPNAIDVYRGKTTLEITYKDGVAIDSVVVFKDEYLKNLKH